MEEKGLMVNAHDVQYSPGPPQSSGRFPCRSGQQQHMLHILLIIGVHGAEELLTADRKVLDYGQRWLLPSATWVACFPLATARKDVQGTSASSNTPQPLLQILWPALAREAPYSMPDKLGR